MSKPVALLPYLPFYQDALLAKQQQQQPSPLWHIQRVESLKFQNRDLSYLLRIQNKQEFLEVIRNCYSSIHIFLDTFLQNYPRPFDFHLKEFWIQPGGTSANLSILNKEEIHLEQLLYKRVFMLIHKIVMFAAQQKEEKKSFLSLFETYILDLPKCIDMCAIYGFTNVLHVRNVIHTLLLLEPEHYLNSLQTYQHTLIQLIQKEIFPFLKNEQQFKDRLHYLYDVTFTIRIVLQVYPTLAEIWMEKSNSQFLYPLLIILYESMQQLIWDFSASKSQGEYLLLMMKQIKSNCFFCIQQLLESKGEEELQLYLTSIALGEGTETVLENLKFAIPHAKGTFFLDYYHFSHKKEWIHRHIANVQDIVLQYETVHQKFVDVNFRKQIKYSKELEEIFAILQREEYSEQLVSELLEYHKGNVQQTIESLINDMIPQEVRHKVSIPRSTTTNNSQFVESALSTPSSASVSFVSTSFWDNAQFFASVNMGKRDKFSEEQSEEERRAMHEKILQYTYDDDYDDTFDSIAEFGVEDDEEDPEAKKLKINGTVDMGKQKSSQGETFKQTQKPQVPPSSSQVENKPSQTDQSSSSNQRNSSQRGRGRGGNSGSTRGGFDGKHNRKNKGKQEMIQQSNYYS